MIKLFNLKSVWSALRLTIARSLMLLFALAINEFTSHFVWCVQFNCKRDYGMNCSFRFDFVLHFGKYSSAPEGKIVCFPAIQIILNHFHLQLDYGPSHRAF